MSAFADGRLDDAEHALRAALALAPDRSSVLLNLSAVLIALGKGGEAVPYALRVTELEPEGVDGWRNLGDAYWLAGEPLRALECLERAAARAPEIAEVRTAIRAIQRTLKGDGNVDIDVNASHDEHVEAEAEARRALSLLRKGNVADAQILIDALAERHSSNAQVHVARGLILAAGAAHEQALGAFERALELDPADARAHANRAVALIGLNRHAEAEPAARRALAIEPHDMYASIALGTALMRTNRAREAMQVFEDALQAKPESFDARLGLGLSQLRLRRTQEAIKSFDQALRCNPENPKAWIGRGDALRADRRWSEAIKAYDAALERDPASFEAICGRALALWHADERVIALRELESASAEHGKPKEIEATIGALLCESGKHPEALSVYDEVLKRNSLYSDAWSGRGAALQGAKRYAEALASYDRAIELSPSVPETWSNRGVTLLSLQRPDEALASLDRALALSPDFAGALANRGTVLLAMRRLEEARTTFEDSVRVDPSIPEAWCNLGIVLADLENVDESIACYDRAIALREAFAEAWSNKAHALAALNRHPEALACYRRALELNPRADYSYGAMIYSKLFRCDWEGLSEDVRCLENLLTEGNCASTPSHLLAIPVRAERLLDCAKAYVARTLHTLPPRTVPPWPESLRGSRHGRIRIGFLSHDLRDHPVGYQMRGVFRHIDRNRFETCVYSLKRANGDRYQDEFRQIVDRFVDIDHTDTGEAVRTIRRDALDVVVDLQGHMKGARMDILAPRVAPIQVNFLCPGTTGAPFIDYILGDSTLIPEAAFRHYSERVVWLPNSFFVTDYSDIPLKNELSRSAQGLARDAFVFACFCESYKITEEAWSTWMELLRSIPGSLLWVGVRKNPEALANLRGKARAFGVDPSRIVAATVEPSRADHVARLQLADLCLDTFIYNGHTTTADALWAGVPVVSRLGEAFPGRVAGSILRAAGLADLVQSSTEDYASLARRLATNPAELAEVRRRIEKARTASPLFDTKRSVRDFEHAMATIVERDRAGLPPTPIDLSVVAARDG